jgi:hypothetical protein
MPTQAEIDQVKALLRPGLDDSLIASAIEDAALLIEPCADRYDSGRVWAITKYLAAHLLASTDQGASVVAESVDGTSYTKKMAQVGTGLNGTTFGQQALKFDYLGCLKRLGREGVKLKVL